MVSWLFVTCFYPCTARALEELDFRWFFRGTKGLACVRDSINAVGEAGFSMGGTSKCDRAAGFAPKPNGLNPGRSCIELGRQATLNVKTPTSNFVFFAGNRAVLRREREPWRGGATRAPDEGGLSPEFSQIRGMARHLFSLTHQPNPDRDTE